MARGSWTNQLKESKEPPWALGLCHEALECQSPWVFSNLPGRLQVWVWVKKRVAPWAPPNPTIYHPFTKEIIFFIGPFVRHTQIGIFKEVPEDLAPTASCYGKAVLQLWPCALAPSPKPSHPADAAARALRLSIEVLPGWTISRHFSKIWVATPFISWLAVGHSLHRCFRSCH
jgi:hypothetical protein